jgi:transcriptional regulator with XRE-family HTH domain
MPQSITANQLVAYNLMRIRKTLGLSQEQAAERLKPFMGAEWSKSVYSTTERSYHGKRVRQFTADDLVAFSRAFGVPVIYFFLPPKPEDRTVGAGADQHDVSGVSGGDTEVSWAGLFEVMFGGEMRVALVGRAFELPREERPAADSYLAQLLNNTAMPTSMEDFARQQAAGEAAFADPGHREDADPS